MVTEKADIEALIALYLKGEASPEEAMQLEDWMSAGRQNAVLFASLEKTYALTHNKAQFVSPDVESVWENIKPQPKADTKVIPLWKSRRFYIPAAAIAVVMFAIGALLNHYMSHDKYLAGYHQRDTSDIILKNTVIQASDMVASFTLQDQSKVELQPGSKLTLSSDFNKQGRNVTLEGSGKFHVVHDAANPFVLKVEGLNVVDIGTIFTVETLNDTVKIVVDGGAVELKLNGKTLDVAQGDSAFYVISQQVIARYKQPHSRKDKIFIFDGTSLDEVVAILGAFYNRKIVIMDDRIAKCKLSVTFKNEELATILDIIKELLDVKIVQNEEIIGIYGEGCL